MAKGSWILLLLGIACLFFSYCLHIRNANANFFANYISDIPDSTRKHTIRVYELKEYKVLVMVSSNGNVSSVKY